MNFIKNCIWVTLVTVLFVIFLTLSLSPVALAQSINSGTVTGVVSDPSGAIVKDADVEISNALTGYRQTTVTDANGAFRFNNVPFNRYGLTAKHDGFNQVAQTIDVRSIVPLTINLALAVAGTSESVQVTESVIEVEPAAHSDVDTSTMMKLPITTAGSGLSEAITMTAPGVVNDSNGFFHPTGDHASYSMQLDGQPINDQFSKNFSTQVPVEALQSTEVTTGFAGAQYGEKTSLVINATTRSGLGLSKPLGSVEASYGSFGTTEETVTLGWGSQKFGNFFVATGSRSGRFLDTPEAVPFHAVGNNGSFFDRIDYQPHERDIFHLNLLAGRNWFQIPNTYDQQAAGQDQRQKIVSFNIAPGYQHTFSPRALLTVNAWDRLDVVHYYPSADLFSDLPATIAQQRRLMSLGGHGDFAYSRGAHNLRLGTQIMQTRLAEHFQLGITDPRFNAVCMDSQGSLDPNSTPTDPTQCPSAAPWPNAIPPFTGNPGFLAGLLPFDLTRDGSIFHFNAAHPISEYAFYATDTISWGNFTLTPGLRFTYYDGLVQATGVQPRIGLAYLIKRTGTVLRLSYSRSMETPANENLLLASSTGAGGLATTFGAFGQAPVPVSRRNQGDAGFQQTFGRFVQVDADYYWKYASPAFEFDVLFTTPITFPIAWSQDKLDGFGIRVSTLNLKGFQLNSTMGYGRLRYFGPETGGLIFNSPLTHVFRTDSDDPFYQTTFARYQWKNNGPWVAFTWRYDFGGVAGAGDDLAQILTLSGDQQHMMGFFCGIDVATPTHQITSCNLPYGQYGATRVQIPFPGTANPDRNPPRVATRNVFDLGIGTDNLLRSTDSKRITLQFTVVNLTNEINMYNFLSTFGGTHFIQPRSYQAKLGFVF